MHRVMVVIVPQLTGYGTRLAVKCDSAEQLGERLKRRYDRRQRQIERDRLLQD